MAAWRGIVFFFAGRFVRCRHRALTEKLVTCPTARFWPGSNSPSPLPSEIDGNHWRAAWKKVEPATLTVWSSALAVLVPRIHVCIFTYIQIYIIIYIYI